MPQATDGQILTFLYELVARGSAQIEFLGDTMETWLLQKGFVLPRDPRGPANQKMMPDWSGFRGRLYNIFGFFASFGFLIMLYSMFLGSSTASIGWFNAKFYGGLVIFTLAWCVLIRRLFYSISRPLTWGIIGASVLFMVVAIDNHVSLTFALTPDAAGIVHSMAGDVKSGSRLMELEMSARVWVLFGFLVSIITLLPFMIVSSTVQAVISLIFSAHEKVYGILKDLVSEDSVVSKLAQIKLQKLAQPHLTTMNFWVLSLALIAFSLAVLPTLIGLMFAVAIGMVSIVAITSKKGFGIVGYDLSKWVHAGTIAVVLGTIALYLLYIGFSVYQMGPYAYIPLGILFLALCVFMPVLVKNTSLRAEREEKGSADADIEDYKLRVTGINPDGSLRKEIVHPEKRKWFTWLRSSKLWLALGALALIAGWNYIGRPNFFAGMFDEDLQIFVGVVVLIIAFSILVSLKSNDSTPTVKPEKH